MKKLKLGNTMLEEIQTLATTNRITLLDAILEYCERNGIEIEHVVALTKRSEKFRSQLTTEAKGLKLLKV